MPFHTLNRGLATTMLLKGTDLNEFERAIATTKRVLAHLLPPLERAAARRARSASRGCV